MPVDTHTAEIADRSSAFLYNALSGAADVQSLAGQAEHLAELLGYPAEVEAGVDITVAAQQRLASGPNAGQLYRPGVTDHGTFDHIRGFARTIAEAPWHEDVTAKASIIDRAISQASVRPIGVSVPPLLSERSRVVALQELESATRMSRYVIPRSEVRIVLEQLETEWWPENAMYRTGRFVGQLINKL